MLVSDTIDCWPHLLAVDSQTYKNFLSILVVLLQLYRLFIGNIGLPVLFIRFCLFHQSLATQYCCGRCCVPSSHRCDGIVHCPNGCDEDYGCTGRF